MSQQIYMLDYELGTLPCRICAINPDEKSAPPDTYYIHTHPSFELHFVEHGHCTLRVQQQSHTISDGECILITPGVKHCIREIDETTAKMAISFELPHPSEVHDRNGLWLVSKLYSSGVRFYSNTMLLPILDNIKSLVQEPRLKYWQLERLKSFITLLILELCGNADEESLANRQNEKLSAFLIEDFLNVNYARNDGREILAKKFHISSRQLDRLMQKLFGMGFREKLLNIRLTNALYFLLSTDRSVADISAQLGYSSQANFSAFIKRETGKTPTEIRSNRVNDG